MKFPKYPPSRTELLQQISPQRLMQILSTVTEPTVSGKYVHWDDLRHREPPSGLTLSEWWLGLTFHRTPDKIIALTDSKGQRFLLRVIELIQEKLHRIDLLTGVESRTRAGDESGNETALPCGLSWTRRSLQASSRGPGRRARWRRK